MLSVAEALERVLSGVPALGTERVTLGEARARVLAEPVVAAREIPPWDNSSMDGYAVRARDADAASTDRPVVLQVVGRRVDLSIGEPWRAGERRSRIVAIGAAGATDADELRARFEGCLAVPGAADPPA